MTDEVKAMIEQKVREWKQERARRRLMRMAALAAAGRELRALRRGSYQRSAISTQQRQDLSPRMNADDADSKKQSQKLEPQRTQNQSYQQSAFSNQERQSQHLEPQSTQRIQEDPENQEAGGRTQETGETSRQSIVVSRQQHLDPSAPSATADFARDDEKAAVSYQQSALSIQKTQSQKLEPQRTQSTQRNQLQENLDPSIPAARSLGMTSVQISVHSDAALSRRPPGAVTRALQEQGFASRVMCSALRGEGRRCRFPAMEGGRLCQMHARWELDYGGAAQNPYPDDAVGLHSMMASTLAKLRIGMIDPKNASALIKLFQVMQKNLILVEMQAREAEREFWE